MRLDTLTNMLVKKGFSISMVFDIVVKDIPHDFFHLATE